MLCTKSITGYQRVVGPLVCDQAVGKHIPVARLLQERISCHGLGSEMQLASQTPLKEATCSQTEGHLGTDPPNVHFLCSQPVGIRKDVRPRGEDKGRLESHALLAGLCCVDLG